MYRLMYIRIIPNKVGEEKKKSSWQRVPHEASVIQGR